MLHSPSELDQSIPSGSDFIASFKLLMATLLFEDCANVGFANDRLRVTARLGPTGTLPATYAGSQAIARFGVCLTAPGPIAAQSLCLPFLTASLARRITAKALGMIGSLSVSDTLSESGTGVLSKRRSYFLRARFHPIEVTAFVSIAMTSSVSLTAIFADSATLRYTIHSLHRRGFNDLARPGACPFPVRNTLRRALWQSISPFAFRNAANTQS